MGVLEQGTTMPTRKVHLTRDDLTAYAAASGDSNPIHADDEAARAVGLPGVVAHGMLTLGAVMAEVAAFTGDRGRIAGFGARFIKPVVVPADRGADLTIGGEVTAADPAAGTAEITLTVTCDGVKVLGMAKAQVVPA